MTPKRGVRVTVPLRTGPGRCDSEPNDAATGWEQLCRHALANTRRRLELLRIDPRGGTGQDRQHRLRGDLATHLRLPRHPKDTE
jgi:hypothetical protein